MTPVPNLGFIRPVENIGSLRFFSIAHERYLLAVEKTSPLALRSEIDIEDLRSERIIAFSRQNLSYSERYFSERFETHGLTSNIAYRSHEGAPGDRQGVDGESPLR